MTTRAVVEQCYHCNTEILRINADTLLAQLPHENFSFFSDRENVPRAACTETELGKKLSNGYTRIMADRDHTLARLTSRMLSQSRVIAKGNRIRDVQRLVETYGGKASQWVKKNSPRFEIGRYQYEYHWYEHRGLERVEVKRQRVQAI